MLALDPIWSPEIQQHHFRLLLEAMSRPGCCYDLPVQPCEGSVSLAVLSSLVDREVSLADPHDLLREQDWPMLQAHAAAPEEADFILCDGLFIPSFVPKLGSLASPEHAATLVIVVDELGHGDSCLKLSGPGISTSHILAVDGLADEWITARDEWVSDFPLGIDMVLQDRTQVAALPRTTRVALL